MPVDMLSFDLALRDLLVRAAYDRTITDREYRHLQLTNYRLQFYNPQTRECDLPQLPHNQGVYPPELLANLVG
jgi:hypothetical protein